MSDPQIIAPVGAYSVDPGLSYEARYRVQRVQDPIDPFGDAVQLAIRWLDRNKKGIPDPDGTAIVANLPLVVADGVQQRIAHIGPGGQLVPPAGTIYCRPFVACYGDDHITDIIVIGFQRILPAGLAPITTVTASTILPDGTWGIVLVSAAAPLTVTLPKDPVLGQTLTIKDAIGSAATYPITIDDGGGFNIEGADTLVIQFNYGWVQLSYTGIQWAQV